MGPTTRQRGKHNNDDQLFGDAQLLPLSNAADDMAYLLDREYGIKSALALVGNRYRLNKRQRMALERIAAGDIASANRQKRALTSTAIAGQTVGIDGFNLLILLENALSGAYVFKGRDGSYRDISSVHGSYKHIKQTEAAILLVGKVLTELEVVQANWYLDQPVSNSGRLRAYLEALAAKHNFAWSIELCYSPDKVLAESTNVVISSDAWILDRAARWFNLGALLIEERLENIAAVAV